MLLTFSFPPQDLPDFLLLGALLGIIALIFIYRMYLKHNITIREKLNKDLQKRNSFLTAVTNKLRSTQRIVKADLKIARQIQLGLLPAQIPQIKEMRLDVIYKPVAEVGGDIYDFFQFDDKKLGVFIGDASGHGFAAAMISTLSKMSLYHHTQDKQSASELIGAINRDLTANINSHHYLTCFWGVFDFERNILTYSRAGHPTPLCLRKDGTLHNLCAEGTLLGLLENAAFKQEEFRFEPGDRFFLFTDGMYDVIHKNRGREAEAMTYNQFAQLIKKTSIETFNTTLSAIEKSLSDFKHEDDYTLIVAEIYDSDIERQLLTTNQIDRALLSQ
ncbi:MAG: serine/threonine-protein phosphatase [Chitinispirillia bacterium]|nr:serine/threonine-protein phosphatase [Chitinispirillia bacterium]